MTDTKEPTEATVSLAPIQLTIAKVTYEFRTYKDLAIAVAASDQKFYYAHAERIYDSTGRLYKAREVQADVQSLSEGS